jgi:putative ABC transport system permease protein
MLVDDIHDAMRSLRTNTLRSALTLLGIVIGVTAVVVVMAVGAGARVRVVEEIRSLGANLLLVSPGSAKTGAVRLGSGTEASLTEGDAEAIGREIPGVSVVAPFIFTRSQVVHGNRNWSTRVQGVTPAVLAAREWPIAAGRGFSTQELESAAKVALMGATVAAEVLPDLDPVGQVVRVGDAPFRVVGVLARKGESSTGNNQDDVLMIPLRTAQVRILGQKRTRYQAVDYILVKVGAADQMKKVETAVRRLLRQRHRLLPDARDDFRVQDLAEMQARSEKASGVLGFWLTVVASVSLLVGGISIMNIMLVSVTERTREIGLRLALGARPQDILSQFLLEAVALSLIGALAGVGLGTLSAWLIGLLGDVEVLLQPHALLLAASFAVAVGLFFGFYPAWRAAQQNPVDALRFE